MNSQSEWVLKQNTRGKNTDLYNVLLLLFFMITSFIRPFFFYYNFFFFFFSKKKRFSNFSKRLITTDSATHGNGLYIATKLAPGKKILLLQQISSVATNKQLKLLQFFQIIVFF